MSAEGRTPLSLGPLGRESYQKVATLASLALMVTVGLVTPAAAVERSGTAHTTAAFGSADNCKHPEEAPGGDHDKDKDKDKCPKPKPPTGCFDIDSVIHGATKYVSAVCNGRVFVLAVAEEPETTPIAPGWVATGGPSDVIDATVAEHGNNVYVTVLTAGGQVQEGTCEVGPGEPGPGNPITTCDFTPLTTPPGA